MAVITIYADDKDNDNNDENAFTPHPARSDIWVTQLDQLRGAERFSVNLTGRYQQPGSGSLSGRRGSRGEQRLQDRGGTV
jgi:hypothetical protein